jgi:DNA-binding GntR family transcriptional regulator
MINESEKSISLSGKKSDLAYAALKRAIVLRQYEPGQQIREQAVASEFQCSQSTVREALINLSKDGLVKRTGYHGTHVTDTTLEEATALVRVRLTIERCVAAQLHARRSVLDPVRIVAILSSMDAAHASGDLFRSSELDRDFHAQLAIMAGMEQLAPVLHRCALHIHRFTLGSVEVPRHFFQEAGVGEEHRALYQLLCEGTERQSESAIAQHLAQVLQRWAPSLYAAVGADEF